jgi:hypothetical protein
MSSNIVDLARERRIAALLHGIAARCAANPALADRTAAFLSEELESMQQRQPTSVRLPEPLIERLDALAAKLNADPERGMERVFKRSDAFRLALIRGIEAMEAELSERP